MRFHALLLFVAAVLSVGCGGPGGRSITEELPLDAVKNLLKKNPKYAVVVEMAEQFRQTASTTKQAQMSELTYERLCDFMTSYYDDDLRDKLEVEAGAQWIAQYGPQSNQVDSLLDYWKVYLENNKPSSYVRVELVQLDRSTVGTGSVRVVLKVIPLKGAVEKVAGRFGIFPHNDLANRFSDYGIARNNDLNIEKLTAPQSVDTWLTYSVFNIEDADLQNMSVAELQRKYSFDYNISSLSRGGEVISYGKVYNTVPYEIRSYWEEKKLESRDEFLRGQIVRELVDPAFVTQSSFIINYREEYHRNIDPLAAQFVIDGM